MAFEFGAFYCFIRHQSTEYQKCFRSSHPTQYKEMHPHYGLLTIPCFIIPILSSIQVSVLAFVQATTNHDFIDDDDNRHILSSESSVMITGAASQLGHALSLALADTYPNIQLILFDQLEAHNLFHREEDERIPPLEEQFEYPPFKDQTRFETQYARFESKRKRISYVLSQIDDNVHFFKTDYRSSLKQFHTPDRFDILEEIMNRYNLTHIVHLEDNLLNPNVSQAIPRLRHDDRMGYFDSILYHLRRKKVEGSYIPNLVYRSTHEIYNPKDIDDGIAHEEWNITSPSSIYGLEKLIEEGLARNFARMHNISSIGLRFFHVYGPFGDDLHQDDPISLITRHQSLGESSVDPEKPKTNILDRQTRDYIYVDDAIDAIMLAMQVKMQLGNQAISTVVNVGSGEANSILHASYILNQEKLFLKDEGMMKPPSQVIASMTRARKLLGFQPAISFVDGINKTISWYKTTFEQSETVYSDCALLDDYCLNGRIIFPCASEWAVKESCTPSVYDSVKNLSLHITSGCDAVQYTVALEKDLSNLPENGIHANGFISSFGETGQMCNIAFVRDDSPLVKSLKEVRKRNSRMILESLTSFEAIFNGILKYGFWTLVTLKIPKNNDQDILNSIALPILSPQSFFRSKYAVYVKSNILFKNISFVINEFEQNLQMEQTVLMVKGMTTEPGEDASGVTSRNKNDLKQKSFFQMIKMALSTSHLRSTTPMVDIDYIVHRLSCQSARSFRRELYHEMVLWKVSDAKESIDFVVSLKDYWSRYVTAKQSFDRSDDIFTVFSKEKSPILVAKMIPQDEDGIVRGPIV